MTRVLVTDGDQRSTLAAVRAFGREGVEVVVGETRLSSLAARSRYCTGAVAYPSPYDRELEFVTAIAAAARHVDLVIPMTDITSAVLAEHRSVVEIHAQVAVPDADTFWRASDKVALHGLAEEIGVPTPTTHYLQRADELAERSDIEFPCVIKPARSRVRTPSGWRKTAVTRVTSRADLQRLAQCRPELRYPFMIQRIVDGEGIGVFALCDRGEPRMLFAHRRLREKPPWGGVSVLREAVPLDAVATDYASRLLRALTWHGVAMVEFKRDNRTGIPLLMEINGRFWGSLQLAIDAGANFPLHAMRLWLGQPLAAQPPYRVGVRSRWLLGDVDHLLLRLNGGGANLRDSTPLLTLLLDFCSFFRRDTRYEVESWRDPGPSLYEIRAYLRALVGGRTQANH